jgi:hypothetical protein
VLRFKEEMLGIVDGKAKEGGCKDRPGGERMSRRSAFESSNCVERSHRRLDGDAEYIECSYAI